MSSDDDISINDLVGELNEANDFGDLKKMASSTIEPLHETSQAAATRATRSAAFNHIKENIDSWGIVVSEVEKQRTISFGNDDEGKKLQKFTPVKSELSNEIDKILEEQKLTKESQLQLEDQTMTHLSEQEYREQLEKLAQLRKIQFYNEMKARRWKKIKSKAFRRLHKKDMAEIPLEELAEVDPEAFQAKMEKIESDRAKERISLRHKNTSQWVKRVLKRGLKAASDDVRKSYEEQLKLGEELTKKIAIKAIDAGEEEEEPEENPAASIPSLKPILDMKFMKEAKERREKEKEELLRMLNEEIDQNDIPSSGIVNIKSHPANNIDPISQEKSNDGIENKNTTAIETETIDPLPQTIQKERQLPKSNPWLKKPKKMTRIVSAYVVQPSTPIENVKETIDFSKKEGQEEELAKMLGFEDEFKKEKEEQALKDASKDLVSMNELHIEGWGSWAGAGAEETEGAKRRRENLERERHNIISDSIIARKDANKDGVILSEIQDIAIEKYSIPKVPYGYSNPKQIQSQLAYPIGPEYNSIAGFNRLIQPDITTKHGEVIEPIFMTKMKKRKERIDRMKNHRKALENSKSLQ